MILWNCRNPKIALTLFQYYIPDDKDRVEIGWGIYNWIKYNPDDCVTIIAIEDNRFCGFVFAHKEEEDLFIWQAKSTAGFKYSNLVFHILKCCAKDMGLKNIRLKADDKLAKFYARKYKFRPSIKGEMVYVLRDSF